MDAVRRQRTALAVHFEHGDAVVAAIAAIEEASVRSQTQVSGVTDPIKICRQRRYTLLLYQRTPLCIEVEGRDRAAELVDHVGVPVVRADGEMAGTSTRGYTDVGLFAGGQPPPSSCVQGVDHHLIHTEIGGKSEAAISGDLEAVCVRLLLPALVNTAAHVLMERRGRPECSAVGQGIGNDTSPVVVGHHDRSPRGIDLHVAGIAALRGLLIDEL